ncbi:MAG: membrane or secreted protein [Bacteroidetes bacterium]|nr:membrane or secreted protein [Bacteroidota bacterium]
MKHLILSLLTVVFSLSISAQKISGAWMRKLDTAVQYLTIVDQYFVITTFDLEGKKFFQTRGGTAMADGKKISGTIEFNTTNKSEVKSAYTYEYTFRKKDLQMPVDGIGVTWNWVDDANTGLAGNWKITGRMQDGKMVAMNPGARKTIKVMSGSRFQWTAINTDTGEFFGTGGGRYTFENGKYSEHIEFFSRDASRVGNSLSFNAELKDGDWHHSGNSSKGDPIYEVWSRK